MQEKQDTAKQHTKCNKNQYPFEENKITQWDQGYEKSMNVLYSLMCAFDVVVHLVITFAIFVPIFLIRIFSVGRVLFSQIHF